MAEARLPELVERVRAIALALPEAEETANGFAHQMRVGKRIFANVLSVDDPSGKEVVFVACRADREEREFMVRGGHPYFAIGSVQVGVVLDARTDWTEVAEVITDSYCMVAPKRLAQLVEGPPPAR